MQKQKTSYHPHIEAAQYLPAKKRAQHNIKHTWTRIHKPGNSCLNSIAHNSVQHNDDAQTDQLYKQNNPWLRLQNKCLTCNSIRKGEVTGQLQT